MNEPKSKAELIQAMISAREELDSLIDQIRPSAMSLAGAPGEWSVKDIIAHLTAYDQQLALTLALRGQKPPDFWIEDIPLDEFNRRLFEENREKALDEVLQQFKDIWRDMLAEVRARSEAYLFGEQSVPGVLYTFRPCDILRSESYGHYLDHVPDLRARLEAAQ